MQTTASSSIAELPPALRSGRAAAPLPTAGESTQELLAEFRQTGRQTCFEEIVRRYGAMVHHVCRQVTGDGHDAEDAAQVVFLVLAERLRAGETFHGLGAWLQQVARRAALDARRARTRRRRREQKAAAREALPEPATPGDGDEIARLVREELDRLPVKYRVPLVLHYFGHLDGADAARELGIKPATLNVRLFRGRKMLAGRLAGRGITLSIAAVAACLASAARRGAADALVRAVAKAACTSGAKGGSVAAPWAMSQAARAAGRHGLTALASSAKFKIVVAAAAVVVASVAGAGAATHHLPDLPSYLDPRRLVPTFPTMRLRLPAPRADAGETKPDASTTPAGGQGMAAAEPVVPAPGKSLSPRPAENPLPPPGLAAAGGRRDGGGGSVGATPPGAVASTQAPGTASPGRPPTPQPGGGAGTKTPPVVGGAVARGAGGHPGRAGAVANAGGPSPGNAAPPTPGVVPQRPQGAAGTNPGGTAAPPSVGAPAPAPGYTPATPDMRPGSDPSSFLWSPGDGPHDPLAVNAVRLTLHGPDGATAPLLTAFDPADPSLPTLPGGHTFVGVWGIQAGAPFDAIDLTVRYDADLMARLGKSESRLALWGYDGSWHLLDGDLAGQDLGQHLIWGRGDSIDFFGVSAPEPGGAAVAAVAAGLLLLRRRRSSHSILHL